MDESQQRWQLIVAEVEAFVAQLPAGASTIVKPYIDEVHASDPDSCPDVKELEEEFQQKLRHVQKLVVDGKEMQAMMAAPGLMKALRARNAKLKSLKG